MFVLAIIHESLVQTSAHTKIFGLAGQVLPRCCALRVAQLDTKSKRSWSHPTIDTKTNIRSKYGPLNGAFVVFRPNNFPFAFNSAAGGDFQAS